MLQSVSFVFCSLNACPNESQLNVLISIPLRFLHKSSPPHSPAYPQLLDPTMVQMPSQSSKPSIRGGSIIQTTPLAPITPAPPPFLFFRTPAPIPVRPSNRIMVITATTTTSGTTTIPHPPPAASMLLSQNGRTASPRPRSLRFHHIRPSTLSSARHWAMLLRAPT